MKSTQLSLAVVALISNANAVKHSSTTFFISPNLAQLQEDPAPAKTEKAAPAKAEKAAPAKAKIENADPAKVDIAAPAKAPAANVKLTPEGTPVPGDPENPSAPLDIVVITKKNIHGFNYNPFGPENPLPQREVHGLVNEHYDQRMMQRKSRDWRTPLVVEGLEKNKYDDTIHTTPDGYRTDSAGVPVQWPNWQPGQWIAARAKQQKQRRDDWNSRAQTNPSFDVTGKTVNQYDDTVHFQNGTRAFKDGVKLQWPNWQPEASLHQDIAFVNPTLDVTGKTVNQWDDTVHFEDGRRAFSDGTKVQWPNYVPESFAQSRELPSELGGAAPSGKVNSWDGLIHNADGTKSFPDGSPVLGVNQWAQKKMFAQISEGPSELGAPAPKAAAPKAAAPKAEAPPAELGGDAPAAPQGKINKYDGLIYKADGSKSFVDPFGENPAGAPVLGVNRWAQRLYQDDLTNESVQDYSNDIAQHNQMKISPSKRLEQLEENEYLDKTDLWNSPDPEEDAAHFDGNFWTSRMPEKYQSDAYPSVAPLKWAN